MIQIIKAEGLRNEDDGVKPYSLQNLGRCIPAKRVFTFSKNFSDPFVCIYLGESCICQTSWISDRFGHDVFNVHDYSVTLYFLRPKYDCKAFSFVLISIHYQYFRLNPAWNEKFTVPVCHNTKR